MRRVLLGHLSRQKSTFLANMSHEIRTPLNGIVGLQYLMRENLDDREKLLEYLSKAEVSADFLKSVITDVLDMSKIENGQMELYTEEMNLKDLVGELETLIGIQAEEKGLHFSVDHTEASYPFCKRRCSSHQTGIDQPFRKCFEIHPEGRRRFFKDSADSCWRYCADHLYRC